MNKFQVLTASLLLGFNLIVHADGDLSRANIQTVTVEMGTNSGGMYFKPNRLEFKTGQAYKIVLKNVDKIKHEVEAHEFAEKLFTRKIEVKNASGGLLAEIKGNISEIEIGPMAEVEWYVVPVQTGSRLEMVCALPGHKEAGMFGTIDVK